MKTIEINVEVKKSMNFQTYTAGELIQINEGDDIEEVRAMAMGRCRKAVMQQMKIDRSV